MELKEIVSLSESALKRLLVMGNEENGVYSCEQMIYPNLSTGKKRISEQELRFVFVEEFKKAHPDLFYSVETPTENKFTFKEGVSDFLLGKGESASADMMIYKREMGDYKRNYMIEFKHGNADSDAIAKDILKLMCETQQGAFIVLLDNTDAGTLINRSGTRKGVLDKIYESLIDFKKRSFKWNAPACIDIIILSIENKSTPYILYNQVCNTTNLKNIFCRTTKVNLEAQSIVKKRVGWELIRI